MTHEKPTPAPVEVTQADREAAEAFWSTYCGGNDLAWRSLSAQSQRETLRAFARHRIAHTAPAGDGSLYLIDGSGQKRPLSITGCQIDTTQDTVVVSPAGEVEPVAWMYTHPKRTSYWRTQPDEGHAENGWTETPLYPAPPADLVELVEALKPFAKAAQIKLCGGDYWTDDKRIQGTDTAFHITFGDLRHAAEALAKHTRAQGEG